jgi:hypothetical protein
MVLQTLQEDGVFSVIQEDEINAPAIASSDDQGYAVILGCDLFQKSVSILMRRKAASVAMGR